MTYPHTAAILRTVKVGTKYTYAQIGVGVCFLQPLDSEMAQAYGVTMTKGFSCYLPILSDVLEKDRLIIDGTTYGVKGMRTHNYGGLKHKRAILEMV